LFVEEEEENEPESPPNYSPERGQTAPANSARSTAKAKPKSTAKKSAQKTPTLRTTAAGAKKSAFAKKSFSQLFEDLHLEEISTDSQEPMKISSFHHTVICHPYDKRTEFQATRFLIYMVLPSGVRPSKTFAEQISPGGKVRLSYKIAKGFVSPSTFISSLITGNLHLDAGLALAAEQHFEEELSDKDTSTPGFVKYEVDFTLPSDFVFESGFRQLEDITRVDNQTPLGHMSFSGKKKEVCNVMYVTMLCWTKEQLVIKNKKKIQASGQVKKSHTVVAITDGIGDYSSDSSRSPSPAEAKRKKGKPPKKKQHIALVPIDAVDSSPPGSGSKRKMSEESFDSEHEEGEEQ
jgi:hypothetical protein